MRETSIMDNLNCKMQAYVRVYEQNKYRRKDMMPIETILQLKVQV